MGVEVKMPRILSIFALLFLTVTIARGAAVSEFKSSLEGFSHNIFNELAQSNGNKNIIFSPFSIQTCLAMVRMGAGGETAAELDRDLGFTGQTTESVADNYFALLSKYENSKILETANKIYVKENYELQDKFKELISTKFFSTVENINFEQSEKAASAINSWVESKTHNIIKDVVAPDSFSSDTRLFVLSAIYFKGEWEQVFSEYSTRTTEFYTDAKNTVKVEMMTKRETLPYGVFPELDAAVIRMPYKDSDLSMWIFLPNSRTGLSAFEKKLPEIQLESLTKIMGKPQPVQVFLPKFKAEFKIELSETLQKLGMTRMFGDADFSKMLKSPEPMQVSKVVHKAFIEVDETGTTAAATTALEAVNRVAHVIEAATFTADHPFYYVIANEDYVPLFQGTVVNF